MFWPLNPGEGAGHCSSFCVVDQILERAVRFPAGAACHGVREIRDRIALAKILEKYLMTEGYRRWERTFQVDYYREIFRLRGWTFEPESTARPQLIGKLTNNIVYDRLHPGVLKKLNELNPKDQTGKRKRKFFQYFTGEIGVPELKEHLSNLVFLMKASDNWHDFIDRLDRAKPKVGDTLRLPL